MKIPYFQRGFDGKFTRRQTRNKVEFYRDLLNSLVGEQLLILTKDVRTYKPYFGKLHKAGKFYYLEYKVNNNKFKNTSTLRVIIDPISLLTLDVKIITTLKTSKPKFKLDDLEGYRVPIELQELSK